MTRRKASKPNVVTADSFPADVIIAFRPRPQDPLPLVTPGLSGVARAFQCPGCGAHYVASSVSATPEEIRSRNFQFPFQCTDPNDKDCEYEAGLGVG